MMISDPRKVGMPLLIRTLLLAMALLLTNGSPAYALSIVDTGPGSSVGGYFLNSHQWLADQFTVTSGATVTDIEGWISTDGTGLLSPQTFAGGTVFLNIRSDSSSLPGNQLFRQAVSISSSTPAGWAGVHGISLNLAPGTYWATFEAPQGSSLDALMPYPAQQPLAKYAFSSAYPYMTGNPFNPPAVSHPAGEWTAFGAPSVNGLGLRVEGTPTQPPPYKPPQWQKDLASSYADLFERTADAIGVETSLIGGALKAAETTLVEGAEYTLQNLAVFFGFKLAEKLQDPAALRGFFVSQGVATVAGCLQDLYDPEFLQQAAILCGANLTGLLFEGYVAPNLREFSVDPPSQLYQTVFQVANSQLNVENPLYQSTIDSIACAGAYLEGVNRSYDRYSGAYAAGDLASQNLQFGAIDNYLTQYAGCARSAEAELGALADIVRSSSPSNVAFDPLLAISMQDRLRNDGFAPNVLLLLQNLGLDQVQIEQVKTDILSFDPYSVSGTLSDALLTDARASGSVAFSSTVPEPQTLALTCLALGIMLLLAHLKADRARVTNPT